MKAKNNHCIACLLNTTMRCDKLNTFEHVYCFNNQGVQPRSFESANRTVHSD